MKEIVVISGKGGTGKTSVTASFAALAKNIVMADCDVDAADLHLILKPEKSHSNDFFSGHVASIRSENCLACGRCADYCRYDAIDATDHSFVVKPSSCEGCKVCVEFCPAEAIDFNEALCGQWMTSSMRFGEMVHARLGIGAENSGKLVSTVREQARKLGQRNSADWIIVDGPPGTGCAVIASITGADAVVIITEPTLSGKHDMLRVLSLAAHFSVPSFVSVNKYDINLEMTESIEREAVEFGARVMGRVPYDEDVTKSQVKELSTVEFSDGPASQAIRRLWSELYLKVGH
ncbi:MAG: ATP-binding protein [Planctomycetes bacterium]|nr:ATP-binding protein [Planctomycetota bacterium]